MFAAGELYVFFLSIGSVSYTHLDVYKRQSISLSVTSGVTHSVLKPVVWVRFSSGCRAVVAVATKPSSFFTLTRS